jgi:uncharacterized membrane protein
VLHLIHPALVHATVAFLIVGGLVEAYGLGTRHEPATKFGGALVVLGTVSLVPTMIAGFLAENVLTLSAAAADAVDDHERFGLLAFGVFVPLLLMKAWGRGRPPDRFFGVYVVGLIVGVALVATAAYLGGLMVYALGVGVATP